jgi:hypothetical protein
VGGRFRQAQPERDLRKRPLLKEPQQHRLTIGRVQFEQGLIKDRAHLPPIRRLCGVVVVFVHEQSDGFSGPAPPFRAQHLRNLEARRGV